MRQPRHQEAARDQTAGDGHRARHLDHATRRLLQGTGSQDAAADAERAPGSESAPLATDETSPEAAHDALLRDSVTLLDNLNGTLDFVEDAEPARVTKVDMDDLVERMHALKARRRQLGEPPGNVQESSQFAMEYLRMMGSWNRFMEHASRLAQNPAAMVHLQEPMQELLLFFDDQDRADDEPS